MATLEKVSGEPVRDRGCDIVRQAGAGTPVRIVSRLLRWHYGESEAQKALHRLLATRAEEAEATAREEIRALVFCESLADVKKERAVAEFLRAGADVRWARLKTPFRMVNAGPRLLIAANPGAKQRLVTEAIYYDSSADDNLVAMFRELFDTEFSRARRLKWDSRERRVTHADHLKPFLVELRSFVTPANLAYRLILFILTSALAFAFGYIARIMAG